MEHARQIAAIHEELPWRDLLSGEAPDAILDRDKVQLVNYLRGKGLQLYFMADLTDGLSRAEEAPQLRALGRSLTEPAVQQAYRDYVLAVARKLNPEFIGLAAETNLIRAVAAPALYAAVVQPANAAAADLRAAGDGGALMFSVQASAGLLGRAVRKAVRAIDRERRRALCSRRRGGRGCRRVPDERGCARSPRSRPDRTSGAT